MHKLSVLSTINKPLNLFKPLNPTCNHYKQLSMQESFIEEFLSHVAPQQRGCAANITEPFCRVQCGKYSCYGCGCRSMRQAKKLKRLKSILVSKTYCIFFTYTYLLTNLLAVTANAVVLLSKPREKRKNKKSSYFQNFLLMRWVRTQPHGTLRSLGCLSANQRLRSIFVKSSAKSMSEISDEESCNNLQ